MCTSVREIQVEQFHGFGRYDLRNIFFVEFDFFLFWKFEVCLNFFYFKYAHFLELFNFENFDYLEKKEKTLLHKKKKAANPLRLSIVLSYHKHRNWIGHSEAGHHRYNINFGYEYFYFVIYFSKFFSQNFLPKIFFPTIFFQLLFKIYFLKALVSMLSRLQRQNGLYVSVLWKIWYTGQYSIPITAYKIFST